MDLKIKDVADLLNVSEKTIRRWLADGKIPAYRLNHQYRFNRFEIENWVMSQKLGSQENATPFGQKNTQSPPKKVTNPGKGGTQQFSLYRALHKGGILYDVPGQTKEQVIQSTVQQIAKNLNLDADVITEMLLDREKLQPTALNKGIGIPHTRDCLLTAGQDVVTLVFPKNPIDYGALDGEPVHTLFFLFACDDKRHLHLLAKIAHFFNQKDAYELLSKRPSKEECLSFVKEWESRISSKR